MRPDDMVDLVKQWLEEERLQPKAQNDPRAYAHFLVRYPAGPQGHMFAVILPKGRDLVAINSMTRVDGGQQDEMKKHMEEDSDDWKEWVHESRLQLIRSGVDWGIHMGHKGEEKPGPMQAFNVSLPIWSDGLTKNEFMHSLRKLWLAKLTLIHEIKFAYGQGTGKPGPVDDWAKNKAQQAKQGQRPQPMQEKPSHEVEFDEGMSFGSGFDPSEWA